MSWCARKICMSLQAKKSEDLFPSLVSFVLVHQWQTRGLEALTRNKIKVWHRVTCWVWPWADFQEHALCGSAPAPRCQPSLLLRCVSALLQGELQSFSNDGLPAQKGGKLKGGVSAIVKSPTNEVIMWLSRCHFWPNFCVLHDLFFALRLWHSPNMSFYTVSIGTIQYGSCWPHVAVQHW